MSSGRVGQAFVLTCFFTAGYGRHRKLGVGFRTAGYGRHRSQWVNIYQFKLQSYCSFKCFIRTGGYGGPVGFLVKKYTCPVIFLGCPGRPGLVFVGP